MKVELFIKQVLQPMQKDLDTLFRRELPIIVGNMARRHFQENFRQGGFVDKGLTPWPKTKRQRSGGKSADAQHGPLMSQRQYLFSEVRYIPGDYRVKVLNEVPYAPIHNWGAVLTPAVTPKMRRFAWAKFYEASGTSNRGPKGRKTAKNTVQATGSNSEAAMWRGLALTKKKHLSIRIPQRQFIGRSEVLENAIRTELESQVEKKLKL